MWRARVPAPVPRIILCRSRLATISSTSGYTALRPRSMMLWPPILTTLTHGRMAKSGVFSVALYGAVGQRTGEQLLAQRREYALIFDGIFHCLLSFSTTVQNSQFKT